MQSNGRYSSTAIALHWLMAVLIVCNFCLGLYMADLEFSMTRVKLFNYHKWAGATILALAALRLLWRLTHRPPADLPAPHWQIRAAHVTHWALYALFFAVPLVGWAYSSAAGFPDGRLRRDPAARFRVAQGQGARRRRSRSCTDTWPGCSSRSWRCTSRPSMQAPRDRPRRPAAAHGAWPRLKLFRTNSKPFERPP